VRREGVAGASVRGVAREAGLSMGSVRHVFANQDDLLRFAMGAVIDQATRRIEAGVASRAAAVAEGRALDAALALLEEVLPLDDERLAEARVWSAFATQAMTDPAMTAIRQEADQGVRQLCHDCLWGLGELNQLHPDRDLERETDRLWALLDGLTLHLLVDGGAGHAERAPSVLRTHLLDLAMPPPAA